jgi:hypothetical protein
MGLLLGFKDRGQNSISGRDNLICDWVHTRPTIFALAWLTEG